MAVGPGKYDKECTEVREKTKARSVLMIVMGGERESGFSAQVHPLDVLSMSAWLREAADEIDRSVMPRKQ